MGGTLGFLLSKHGGGLRLFSWFSKALNCHCLQVVFLSKLLLSWSFARENRLFFPGTLLAGLSRWPIPPVSCQQYMKPPCSIGAQYPSWSIFSLPFSSGGAQGVIRAQ